MMRRKPFLGRVPLIGRSRRLGQMGGAIEAILAGWSQKPREVYAEVSERYGPPDEATPTRMIWFDRAPWGRTVLYQREIPHDWPKPHTDLLEQTIFYHVPIEAFTPLAEYDGSVIVERTKGTLAARCDKIEMNFLAVNLAVDIIEGRRTVSEARRFYEDTVRAVMAGEMPEYTQRFMFRPPVGYTGDPDFTVIQE